MCGYLVFPPVRLLPLSALRRLLKQVGRLEQRGRGRVSKNLYGGVCVLMGWPLAGSRLTKIGRFW